MVLALWILAFLAWIVCLVGWIISLIKILRVCKQDRDWTMGTEWILSMNVSSVAMIICCIFMR